MPSVSLEHNRYFRQLLLPGVGEEGQQKLQQARVLVIGTGGLGSPVLYYLAAAGVGTLGFMDDDQVEITNLQRQILHWEKDLNQPKSRSALEKLQAFNSSLQYEPYSLRLTEQNAQDFIPKYDLVIAAVDNNETRALINQMCYFYKIPWIDGGIREFVGTLSVFLPPHPPCYACMYNRPY
ncbi:MAG: HesA/MoeB/ThiF family protein, partial [Spirochaetales bacterium]